MTDTAPTAAPAAAPPTARYALLIHEDESAWADAGPDAFAQSLAAHGRFAEAVYASGASIVSAEALAGTATSTTVRGDVVTDGPFAETKEAFGGFYVVDARDLDHAIALARLCPMGGGCVEVRPVLDTSS